MSKKHLKYSYRLSASKLHKLVGDLLRSHPAYKNLSILQEYPIPSTRYHVDWFITELKLAIEVHGEQHYQPVCFGGISKEDAEIKLIEQHERDKLKKRLCIAAGWKYIDFAYNDPIDYDLIGAKITQAIS